MRLASALRDARSAGAPIVVPYLMVDRARRRRLETTVRALREAGATALELGFPFSDPIADGPVLGGAHERALRDGTSWNDLLRALRVASPLLPTAVMTYSNPLVHRGLEEAVGDLAAAGATGLIVPDLSFEEARPFQRASRHVGVAAILLAAPGISTARVARIARSSRGFLYLVGHYGTTGGAAQGATVDLRPSVASAHEANPDLPVLIGFGVRDRASAERALSSGADGVVVGSALEHQLRRDPRPAPVVRFLRSIVLARRPASSRTG
ncbi:MAG: tryptophan synthase subunit alpha [Thermoplasmata archaeon]